jgi:hypothetical protein
MRLCLDIDWYSDGASCLRTMLIAFLWFLRKNNFIVTKADAFITRRHLYRSDMNFGRSDVTFTLNHSKANRFHEHVHRTVQIPGHLQDPVHAVAKAFRVYRMLTTAPAFALPARCWGSMTSLTHWLFVNTL